MLFNYVYISPDVNSSETCEIGGLVADLAGISALLDILDVLQSFDHGKSSSISRLIKGKSTGL